MLIILNGVDEKSLFDIFESIFSILGNFGIFIITFYGFWLYHFSKKIKITDLSYTFSRFRGESRNCTIYNKTLSPKTISKISVVYDNKYILEIKNFEEPFVLEPFKAYSILGDRCSKPTNIPICEDIYFIIDTPGKRIMVPYHGKIKKKAKLEQVSKSTHKFNDDILGNAVKYALVYWYKGEKEQHTIYITNDGFLEQNFRDFNLLPREILGNSKEMVNFFKQAFNDSNWCFTLYELSW